MYGGGGGRVAFTCVCAHTRVYYNSTTRGRRHERLQRRRLATAINSPVSTIHRSRTKLRWACGNCS